METLRGVFSTVPTAALLRVMEVCDQSVAVASAWLLENDWHELMDEAEDEAQDDDEARVAAPGANVTAVGPSAAVTMPLDAAGGDTELGTATDAASASARTTEVDGTAGNNRREQNVTGPFFARRSVGGAPFQEAFDSEDEDEAAENDEGDEDEDEDEEDMYYDSGDEAGFRVGGVLPLTKRVKITTSKEEGAETKADDFWVAFDDQVVIKSMIGGTELLNTTLGKLAHSKVVLLNQPAKDLDETAASVKLRSILSSEEAIGGAVDAHLQSPRDTSNRTTLSSLLNGGSSPAEKGNGKLSSSSESPTTTTSEVPVGQKRKRKEEAGDKTSPRQGFFAHFFPVRELDMVWRTVMHAHLFKGRFGEKIEFHTASGGPFSKRDFDELMHIHSSTASTRAASLGFSPLSTLKCCLILPCPAEGEEIFRVGKNIHSMLKVQGSLYYQVLETPPQANNVVSPRSNHFALLGKDEKLTEERFRQFARYRVKEDEEHTSEEAAMPSNVVMDPYMSYQQPRKIKYCLQVLDNSKWSSRLSG
ncbi:hypothetical protein PHYPSEUDO_006380 [Phytophthora pseudosyringae]|uniref:CUE domain-containing protein n=1 Tax=Phytophthora pseudosyringae TaxID=221518 RepID=A0A8T1WC08_9STRA|nr:hypothetical protein PHYPSEUDO_006380 [Phytophthora pseudosyringae]